MKTLLKLILVLVVLLIAAAFAAPYFISADRFKPQIIAKVQAATGRTLTIGGKLHLTFFPVAGVTAENVSLSNPQGFDDKTAFVSLKSLKVEVALMPLLSKHIEVKSFVLDEPKINLHENAAGIKNWEFAAAQPATQAPTPAEAPAAPAGGGLPNGLVLGGAEIHDGLVSYTNDQQKSTMSLSKLNTTVDMKSLTSPFKFSGSGEWNGKMVKVSADVSSLDAVMNHGSADVSLSISSDLLNVGLKGGIAKDVLSGKTTVASSSLKDLATWANPAAKPLPTPAKLAFNLAGDVACNAGGCSLGGATLSLDAIKAQGTVKVATGGAKPSIDLDITTGVLDINPFLPPEPAQHANLLI